MQLGQRIDWAGLRRAFWLVVYSIGRAPELTHPVARELATAQAQMRVVRPEDSGSLGGKSLLAAFLRRSDFPASAPEKLWPNVPEPPQRGQRRQDTRDCLGLALT